MKTRRLQDLHRWATTAPVEAMVQAQPHLLWHIPEGTEKPIPGCDFKRIFGAEPPATVGVHFVATDRGALRVITIPLR